MRKILLDTNFLLIPSQFNIDIFSEIERIILEKYQIYIIDKTIDELNKIIIDKKQKTKDKLAAKLGLQLIKAKNIKIIKTKEDLFADDILVKLEGYTIATQDQELKKRLKCPIIVLRSKKTLILV